MDFPKEHFALLLFFNQKKTVAESLRILIETYDNAPSIKTCEYCSNDSKVVTSMTLKSLKTTKKIANL